MFKYKMAAMRGEIDEKGHLKVVRMSAEVRELYECEGREDAIDISDSYRLSFMEEHLTEPGSAVIVRVYENNTEDPTYEKELRFMVIVRGYRPAGFDNAGEQIYIRDEFETPLTPVYDTYERFTR